MPRPIWSGSLNFGLVNVPVRLMSAVRDLDLHFRQLHASDDTPIETRRVCSEEDDEVDYDDIGNEYEGVVLTDAELAAADPKKTRRSRSRRSSSSRRSTRSTSTTRTSSCPRARPTARSAPTGCSSR